MCRVGIRLAKSLAGCIVLRNAGISRVRYWLRFGWEVTLGSVAKLQCRMEETDKGYGESRRQTEEMMAHTAQKPLPECLQLHLEDLQLLPTLPE